MKRFKFTLQTVHKVREMKRDKAEQELADASVELIKAQAHLDEVLRQRGEAMARYAELHSSQEIHNSTVVMHTDYIGSLMEFERRARAAIKHHENIIAGKRSLLVEASRASETTANLRERQFERHSSDVARDEQNLLDEMAVMSSNRRRGKN